MRLLHHENNVGGKKVLSQLHRSFIYLFHSQILKLFYHEERFECVISATHILVIISKKG